MSEMEITMTEIIKTSTSSAQMDSLVQAAAAAQIARCHHCSMQISFFLVSSREWMAAAAFTVTITVIGDFQMAQIALGMA